MTVSPSLRTRPFPSLRLTVVDLVYLAADHDRPAPAATAADEFCYIAVNVHGRLSVAFAPDGGHHLFPLTRRTTSGHAYRLDVADDITAWTSGDGGANNTKATQMCLTLALSPLPDLVYTDPVGGPVLFTGWHAGHPVGLTDDQCARIVDAHAADRDWLLT
jgi:hypothetical protein